MAYGTKIHYNCDSCDKNSIVEEKDKNEWYRLEGRAIEFVDDHNIWDEDNFTFCSLKCLKNFIGKLKHKDSKFYDIMDLTTKPNKREK